MRGCPTEGARSPELLSVFIVPPIQVLLHPLLVKDAGEVVTSVHQMQVQGFEWFLYLPLLVVIEILLLVLLSTPEGVSQCPSELFGGWFLSFCLLFCCLPSLAVNFLVGWLVGWLVC